MSVDTVNFLKKSAEKAGFVRESFEEARIPTDPSSITVFPFFGDFRSLFVLSSFVLRAYREAQKASKYFILCSWPGFANLFPFVDEYWGVKANVLELYKNASGFKNEAASPYYRNLNTYFFEDIVFEDNFVSKYYDSGLTDFYWDQWAMKFLPNTLSGLTGNNPLRKHIFESSGHKVFISPLVYVPVLRLNSVQMMKIPRGFYVSLIERLLPEGYMPVVCKNAFTYDLSTDFLDKCVHMAESSIGKILAAMRYTGCVVDFFGGLSRFAIAARCPFVCFIERAYYWSLREYEIDDLCASDLEKRYIFSFPTMIESGDLKTWGPHLFDGLIVKLNSFLPTLDRENWPSPVEVYEGVDREQVRKRSERRFGTRFLRFIKEF